MIRIVPLLLLCAMLSSCETLKNIQSADSLGGSVGSFRLDPVQENNYWYDGRSYEYNGYEIKVTSEPSPAIIQWNGKVIGTTPFTYRYTGTIDRDDRVTVCAIPKDEKLPAQEATLRIRTELPRKIHFDLDKGVEQKERR